MDSQNSTPEKPNQVNKLSKWKSLDYSKNKGPKKIITQIFKTSAKLTV